MFCEICKTTAAEVKSQLNIFQAFACRNILSPDLRWAWLLQTCLYIFAVSFAKLYVCVLAKLYVVQAVVSFHQKSNP